MNKHNLNDIVYILSNDRIYKGIIEGITIFKKKPVFYTVSYYNEENECQSNYAEEDLVFLTITDLLEYLIFDCRSREKDSYL